MIVAPWVLYLCVANVAISYIEYVYRVGSYNTFLGALPHIIVPIIIGQWGLFHGYVGASSLIVAGATFTAINLVLRVCNMLYIGESLNTYNVVGLLLFFVSLILIKIK